MAAIAVLAWVLVVDQARDMGVEPGTMGMGVPLFLLLWLVMMIAMMFPSVAPTVALYSQMTKQRSPRAPLLFTCGYLLTWTAAGVVTVDASRCTIEDEDLYSYRRQGKASGRLAGLVWVRP